MRAPLLSAIDALRCPPRPDGSQSRGHRCIRASIDHLIPHEALHLLTLNACALSVAVLLLSVVLLRLGASGGREERRRPRTAPRFPSTRCAFRQRCNSEVSTDGHNLAAVMQQIRPPVTTVSRTLFLLQARVIETRADDKIGQRAKKCKRKTGSEPPAKIFGESFEGRIVIPPRVYLLPPLTTIFTQ